MKKDIPRDQATGPLLTFKWVCTEEKTVCQATLDSRMRRNSRISGANVKEEFASSSSCEKVEERRNIYRQKNPFQ